MNSARRESIDTRRESVETSRSSFDTRRSSIESSALAKLYNPRGNRQPTSKRFDVNSIYSRLAGNAIGAPKTCSLCLQYFSMYFWKVRTF